MSLYSAPRVKCKGFLEGVERQGRALLADDKASELQMYGVCVNASKVCRLLEASWLRKFADPLPPMQEEDPEQDEITFSGILDKVSAVITALRQEGRIAGLPVRQQVHQIYKDLARFIQLHSAFGHWEEEALQAQVERSAMELCAHLENTLLQAYDAASPDSHFGQACFLGKLHEWLGCCFAPDWQNLRNVGELQREREPDEMEVRQSIADGFNSVLTKVSRAQCAAANNTAGPTLRDMFEDICAVALYLQPFLEQELQGEDEEATSTMGWSHSAGAQTVRTTQPATTVSQDASSLLTSAQWMAPTTIPETAGSLPAAPAIPGRVFADLEAAGLDVDLTWEEGFLVGVERHGRALLADDQASELQKYGLCVNASRTCRLLQTSWWGNFSDPLLHRDPGQREITLQGILDEVSGVIDLLGQGGHVPGRTVRQQVDQISEALSEVIEQHPGRGRWDVEALKAEVQRSAVELVGHFRKTLLQAADERSPDSVVVKACFLGRLHEWLQWCFAADWQEQIDELEARRSMDENDVFKAVYLQARDIE